MQNAILKGANFECRDSNGANAFMIACENGYQNAVKYFLTLTFYGTHNWINVIDFSGDNALHYAVHLTSEAMKSEIVDILVSNQYCNELLFMKNKNNKLPINICKNSDNRDKMQYHMRKKSKKNNRNYDEREKPKKKYAGNDDAIRQHRKQKQKNIRKMEYLSETSSNRSKHSIKNDRYRNKEYQPGQYKQRNRYQKPLKKVKHSSSSYSSQSEIYANSSRYITSENDQYQPFAKEEDKYRYITNGDYKPGELSNCNTEKYSDETEVSVSVSEEEKDTSVITTKGDQYIGEMFIATKEWSLTISEPVTIASINVDFQFSWKNKIIGEDDDDVKCDKIVTSTAMNVNEEMGLGKYDISSCRLLRIISKAQMEVNGLKDNAEFLKEFMLLYSRNEMLSQYPKLLEYVLYTEQPSICSWNSLKNIRKQDLNFLEKNDVIHGYMYDELMKLVNQHVRGASSTKGT